MDFRSQLSAFQSGGGSAGGSRGGGGADRSPNRTSNRGGYRDNNNRDNRDNNRDNNNNRDNYYGRGGGGGRGRGGDDRRRPRDSNHPHIQGGPPNQRRRYHSPDRDGLGDLRNFGYRIPKGLPTPPTPQAKQRKAKHLALLVISIDDLPYEHIWKAWSQTLNNSNNKEEEEEDDYYISLVCHAKYPKQVKSPWLRQRLLVHPPKVGRGNSFLDPEYLTRTPNWGSIEITRAMVDLLQASMTIGRDQQTDMRFAASRFLVRRPPPPSLADLENSTTEWDDPPIPPVDQFIYVSETCIPVGTAQDTFAKMQDTTVSWVNARHRKDPDTPKNLYENDQFAGIHRRIPGQYRWKADQWVLLCRNHAQQILDMDHYAYSSSSSSSSSSSYPPKHPLWQSFRDINASDEMYIPTCLAVLGLLRIAANGEDTQRSRSQQVENGNGSISSEQQRSRSRSNSNVDDKPRGRSNSHTGSILSEGDKTSATTATVVVAPPVVVDQVVLNRPVTYTDWTEGMRNPASFTRGLVDFKRVARLARAKGCLVARKFAPYLALPGVPRDELKITGQMTAEEWKEEVQVLQAQDEAQEAAAAITTTVAEEEDEQEGATKEEEVVDQQNAEEENDEKESNEDDDQEESFLLNNNKGATNEEDGEQQEEDGDEDEEEGETQLE
jgi:hypothetical protein